MTTYAWTVRVQRSSPPHYDNLDSYTFTVAAETSEGATKKAIRQAKDQSGFQARLALCGAGARRLAGFVIDMISLNPAALSLAARARVSREWRG